MFVSFYTLYIKLHPNLRPASALLFSDTVTLILLCFADEVCVLYNVIYSMNTYSRMEILTGSGVALLCLLMCPMTEGSFLMWPLWKVMN